MPTRLIVWLPVLGIMSLLGACGSDGVAGSAATVQERIDRCQNDLASCEKSSDECNAGAMDCMDAVSGNGVQHDDIAEHCDALYDLCSTKTDDLTFCEDLRQACFECVHRYDDDEDSDSDSDSDEDSDSDSDSDSHSDSDEDRCDRHDDDRDHDDDHDGDRDHDDDHDGDRDHDDYDDEDSDCDQGGSGGMTGTGGSGGMTGTGGSGGMTGTGGSGGMAGSGGVAGTGGTMMGVSFAADIQPYFESAQADCVGCHSGGGPAGVDLDSYANILAGGDGFPLVVPGDSSDPSAALIPQLNRNHFNGPDDAGFVVILAQWIDEGAFDN